MGNCVAPAETDVPNTKIYDDGTVGDIEGELYIMIAGIDYSCCAEPWGGRHALDTRPAWEAMKSLSEMCNPRELRCFWNQECTKENMTKQLQEVASMCGDKDYFIFYYTGHGDRLHDEDGDEEDGFDECMCWLGPDGQAEPQLDVWMKDDDWAHLISNTVSKGTKIINIFDCCHSGTLMDFTHEDWEGHTAVAISGCQDSQTSAGTGRGGHFTRALTAAIDVLQKDESRGCTAARVFNETVDQYFLRKQPGHTQSICLTSASKGIAQSFVWPLIPEDDYDAPVFAEMGVEGTEMGYDLNDD